MRLSVNKRQSCMRMHCRILVRGPGNSIRDPARGGGRSLWPPYQISNKFKFVFHILTASIADPSQPSRHYARTLTERVESLEGIDEDHITGTTAIDSPIGMWSLCMSVGGRLIGPLRIQQRRQKTKVHVFQPSVSAWAAKPQLMTSRARPYLHIYMY
jgi:hypothetical protein